MPLQPFIVILSPFNQTVLLSMQMDKLFPRKSRQKFSIFRHLCCKTCT